MKGKVRAVNYCLTGYDGSQAVNDSNRVRSLLLTKLATFSRANLPFLCFNYLLTIEDTIYQN